MRPSLVVVAVALDHLVKQHQLEDLVEMDGKVTSLSQMEPHNLRGPGTLAVVVVVTVTSP